MSLPSSPRLSEQNKDDELLRFTAGKLTPEQLDQSFETLSAVLGMTPSSSAPIGTSSRDRTPPALTVSTSPIIPRQSSNSTLSVNGEYDPRKIFSYYPIPQRVVQSPVIVAEIRSQKLLEELVSVTPNDLYHTGAIIVNCESGAVTLSPFEQIQFLVCAHYYADLPKASNMRDCYRILGYYALIRDGRSNDVDDQNIRNTYMTLDGEHLNWIANAAAKLAFPSGVMLDDSALNSITEEYADASYVALKTVYPAACKFIDFIDVVLNKDINCLQPIPKLMFESEPLSVYVSMIAKGTKPLPPSAIRLPKFPVSANVFTSTPQSALRTEMTAVGTLPGESEEEDANIASQALQTSIPREPPAPVITGWDAFSRAISQTTHISQPRRDERQIPSDVVVANPPVIDLDVTPPQQTLVGEANIRPDPNLLRLGGSAGSGQGRNTTAFRSNAVDLQGINKAISDIALSQDEVVDRIDILSDKVKEILIWKEEMTQFARNMVSSNQEISQTLGLILNTLNSRNLDERTSINRTLFAPVPSESTSATQPIIGNVPDPSVNKAGVIAALRSFNDKSDVDKLIQEIKTICKTTSVEQMSMSVTAERLKMPSVRNRLISRLLEI